MKKVIVVGIDFSDCSINALDHAIDIANRAQADVMMVWVNRPETGKEIYKVDPGQIINEASKRFEDLKQSRQGGLSGGKISYQIRKGKVYKEIVQAAEEVDAFLIVVGTHGASGFEEFWIGSNANRIVSAAERPIITIRGGIDMNIPISRIVMPIDSTVESRQKVPFTTLLAKYYKAEIHVLTLFSSPLEELRDVVREYVNQVKLYLTENQIKHTVVELEADNLTDITIDYAIKIDANLISIMDEQETTTANIWLGPYAQQMVNHSPIPVLCIHAKDLIAGAEN
ncbi:MAG: universal stress protein [Bacteroidia bacterium]|jgi:nucleotide-binding universal stress UspA family protein|nr:universal stress protein [Bacteroidia bacterium]